MSSMQACCVCLVWRSNPMWTKCDERIRQDLLCHYLCRCTRKRPKARMGDHRICEQRPQWRNFMASSTLDFEQHKMITNDTDTQRKQWNSSCHTSTNLCNTGKKKEGRKEKGEKRKNWRKHWEKGKNWRRKVEREEEERREGWEARRAVGLLNDTANVVGILPAMSRPPLHEKRPCSNRFGKTQKNAGKTRKMQIWAERTLVRSPRQCNFWKPSTRERPGTDSDRARVAQQLRKNQRKCHKSDRTQFSPLSKIHQKCLKNMAKTTNSCAKSAKIQQKQGKNDNLMSKIDQQRVLCFRNLWASKN